MPDLSQGVQEKKVSNIDVGGETESNVPIVAKAESENTHEI